MCGLRDNYVKNTEYKYFEYIVNFFKVILITDKYKIEILYDCTI